MSRREIMSKIEVRAKEKIFPVAPSLYGLFFEDINRAGDSGLYPEMLRNRSFEDSIPPERCTLSADRTKFTTMAGWSDQFNNGEGLSRWMEGMPPASIPAWYADKAVISLDSSDTLNKKRLVSMRADFSAGGSVLNSGFRGIPLKKGNEYKFYMFAKAKNAAAKLKIAICSAKGAVQDEASFTVEPGMYRRYDCVFTAAHDDFDARLVIKALEASSVNFGFTSLMPADTYKGHGMRKDLMEMLAGTNSKFLRFPGGCIVEGFTYETAMRFQNTIGPVWERPSHVLMWHYRTSNGLGFHEYLQICEDLNLEPLYVINCGMTCQARAPELFEGSELEQFVTEALDAIEYAVGGVDTPMGKKRAEAGHPSPFKMIYIEIGNENHGPDYLLRYKKFYEALKGKYPKIKYIANVHTEHNGLPTEITDEHYYSTPVFFAENIRKFENYDRRGPEIFVGEYAANSGVKPGTLRCALGEAMFLAGIENNQDIVTMTAYAPLFENINFSGWKPNLITFDSHRTYGIPTYHMISMMAGNRGKELIYSHVETDSINRGIYGLPGIMSAKGGMVFRNARLNGKPVLISREIQGGFTRKDNEYTAVSDPSARANFRSLNLETMGDIVWAVFGDEPSQKHEFEVEAKSSPDNPITITVFSYRPLSYFNIDETAGEEWSLHSVKCCEWTVNGQASTVTEGNIWNRSSLGEDAAISVNLGEYNSYKVITREDGFDCYINGKLIQKANIPRHPELAASASVEDDTIILKIANIKGETESVNIALDCTVCSVYEVLLLAADDPDSGNSLDDPLAVSPVSKTLTGAAQQFAYQAPANSLSILRLTKLGKKEH